MNWSLLSKIDAASVTSVWQQMDKADFEAMVLIWNNIILEEIPESYVQMRKDVINAYNETKITVQENTEYRKKKDYYTDLIFGIKLYLIMQQYNMGVRIASNDQVWMYLCVKVFPDIVCDRFPGGKIKAPDGSVITKNIPEDRFWKERRRIYLKTLWWYIYLSLQEDDSSDLKNTFKVLEKNTTDEIVQLVERSGAVGYRVDVYREIMKYYSEHRDKYGNKEFRQVMVLNTAKTKVVEPELVEGGVSRYVKSLFDFVS